MVGQLHFARVAWKASGLRGSDIEEHLFRIRRDHMDRTIAHLHGGPLGMRLPGEEKFALRRQARRSFHDDGFQPPHRLLVRSPANVARAVIVIVGEYATDFAVLLDARGPIMLISVLVAILLHLGERPLLIAQSNKFLDVFLIGRLPALFGLFQFLSQRFKLLLTLFEHGIRRHGRQRLAEIGVDSAAVIARVETRQHALAIRSHPDAHVEWRSFGRLLA